MVLYDPEMIRREGGEEVGTEVIVRNDTSYITRRFPKGFQLVEILFEWDSSCRRRVKFAREPSPHVMGSHKFGNTKRARILDVLEDDPGKTTVSQLPLFNRRMEIEGAETPVVPSEDIEVMTMEAGVDMLPLRYPARSCDSDCESVKLSLYCTIIFDTKRVAGGKGDPDAVKILTKRHETFKGRTYQGYNPSYLVPSLSEGQRTCNETLETYQAVAKIDRNLLPGPNYQSENGRHFKAIVTPSKELGEDQDWAHKSVRLESDKALEIERAPPKREQTTHNPNAVPSLNKN
ncbi:hypothetical protein GGU11DRAFT_862094 [Lentinula aff. detonsa]|nr:hypothetical protein GGU11DRAFT_862094 [Lentinula aff. detonsa]